MSETELRKLIESVRTGSLTRRDFVSTMLALRPERPDRRTPADAGGRRAGADGCRGLQADQARRRRRC